MWCEYTWDKEHERMGNEMKDEPFTKNNIVNGKAAVNVEAVEKVSKNRKVSKKVSAGDRAGTTYDTNKMCTDRARSSYSPVKGGTKTVTWKDEEKVSGSQSWADVCRGKNKILEELTTSKAEQK